MNIRNNSGFTLIELVTFIVVGAIFVPASIVAFTSVMDNFLVPDYQVKARFLAEQKIEDLTKDDFGSINTGSWPYSNTIYSDYKWMWTVCYTGSTEINSSCSLAHAESSYKRIEVVILMPNNTQYSVQTLVTKRPRS